MSTVTDAFAALRRIAQTGSPFRYDQVYFGFESETPERCAALVGPGYDIERKVQVPDDTTDITVEGTFSVRVIDAFGPGFRGEGPALIIRINLNWTTTGGAEHRS